MSTEKHSPFSAFSRAMLIAILSLCLIAVVGCSKTVSSTEEDSESAQSSTTSTDPESKDHDEESPEEDSTSQDDETAEGKIPENIDNQGSALLNETGTEANSSNTATPAVNNSPSENAGQPEANQNNSQTGGNHQTTPSNKQECNHDWKPNIVRTYQPVQGGAMLCNECELWMRSEAEIDAHRKANGWGTGHGGWHSGAHYAGYCAYCGGYFEWVQDHFSRPNCHDQYIQNCSCGRNAGMRYDGAGVVVDGKICSLCGATDPNW